MPIQAAIKYPIYNSFNTGNISELAENIPIEFDFIWSGPAKDDSVNDNRVSGTYLKKWILTISDDPEFSTILYESSISSIRGEPENNPRYSDLYPDGLNSDYVSEYKKTIPRSAELQSNIIYYFKITAFVVDGHVARSPGMNGILFTGHSYLSSNITRGRFRTVENRPLIEFYINLNENEHTGSISLGATGGNVRLQWNVTSPHGHSSPSVTIRPISYPELGNVSNIGSAIVNVTKTERFILNASNENGESNAFVDVFVEELSAPPTEFVGYNLFDISDVIPGENVIYVGESIPIEVYTEHIKDLKIFITYPRNDNTVSTYDVTPKKIMQTIVNENSSSFNIKIPDINGEQSSSGIGLPINKGISGSLSYDFIGIDNSINKKISMYFKLINVNGI